MFPKIKTIIILDFKISLEVGLVGAPNFMLCKCDLNLIINSRRKSLLSTTSKSLNKFPWTSFLLYKYSVNILRSTASLGWPCSTAHTSSELFSSGLPGTDQPSHCSPSGRWVLPPHWWSEEGWSGPFSALNCSKAGAYLEYIYLWHICIHKCVYIWQRQSSWNTSYVRCCYAKYF